MEQPLHTIKTQQSIFTSRRMTALVAAILLQGLFAWLVASGLAKTLVDKLPQEIKAEVLPEKLPDKTPPPPPPDLKEPPPPFVPPPDIVIQMESSAPTSAITTQSKVATPQQISTPASIGRPHICGQDYYPSISMRLGEEGTTLIGFEIGTDGLVQGVHVVGSSGSQRLDEAAVRCAASWRYRAATQNGAPVAVSWKANVVWKLPK